MKYEIYFTAYHEGEMWDRKEFQDSGFEFRLTQIWDGWKDGGILDDLGIDQGIIRQFFEQRVLLDSDRTAVPEKYRSVVLQDAVFSDEMADTDVYLLCFDSKKVLQVFLDNWLGEKIPESARTGADDGTYDYYPDIWQIGKQIAEAIGAQKVYNRRRQELFANSQYGDGGELQELIEEAE